MEAEFRNHNRTKSKEEAQGFSRMSLGNTTGKQIRQKKDVCNEIIERLRESGHEAVDSPGFVEGLHAHFQHLPVRYAMDVNPERAEDVLGHKRLLELARTNKTGPPIVHVRSIHVVPTGLDASEANFLENPSGKEDIGGIAKPSMPGPPSFGTFASLEALAVEMIKPSGIDNDRSSNANGLHSSPKYHVPMHEVTFSTMDKPKLLSELSSVLAEVGLNIREAHVFSTDDGYSLDVFLVDGWPTEDTEELQHQLWNTIADSEKKIWAKDSSDEAMPDAKRAADEFLSIPSDGTDDWEIDPNLLRYGNKVASGSFGDLFRGTYCGQDVAIKVLKPERLNKDLQKEFAQEVSIMRKVRHKNVVQFIGACTRPPNLCIVTEFMSGGSVYDHLHKKHGSFKLPNLLKVAIDISKGMDFLHQCNIIHRDLKAANLLIDEHEVIKVADFGVARVQSQSGVMTAETGTYRWMAPEVIEHQPYDHKADVFSFGIVMWELLTGKLPYDHLTPLQAAVGVVQKGLRPTIPKNVHPKLADLLLHCWKQNPAERPEFSEITRILRDFLKEVIIAEEEKEKKKGGFFSALKRKPSFS